MIINLVAGLTCVAAAVFMGIRASEWWGEVGRLRSIDSLSIGGLVAQAQNQALIQTAGVAAFVILSVILLLRANRLYKAGKDSRNAPG